MVNVNLHPNPPARFQVHWKTLLVTGVATLLVLSIGFWVVVAMVTAGWRGEIAELQLANQGLGATLERSRHLDALLQEIQTKSQGIQALSAPGISWSLVLDELRRIAPSGVVLDSVRCQVPLMSIAGRAGSLEALAEFAINIREAQNLGQPVVRDSTWDPGVGAFIFSLTCAVEGGETGD